MAALVRMDDLVGDAVDARGGRPPWQKGQLRSTRTSLHALHKFAEQDFCSFFSC
jgi:hypothetical protein